MALSPCFPTVLAKKPSDQNSPPHSCFLTCGQRLNISRAVTLCQHPHDLCHTVSWYRLNQKMHMILVRAYLQKLHLIAFRNFQTYFFQNCINPLVEHCSSVLRRKYQVVHQHRYVVTLVDIFAHPQSLRRKRRGIQPEEIKDNVLGAACRLSVNCRRLIRRQGRQHRNSIYVGQQ